MAKAKILVVDDEIDIIELVKLRLQSNGCEVMAAYDGEQALEKVKDYKPDLILLDIKLPIMSGEEVYKSIKSDPITEKIPVILFTASGGDELAKMGANGFIKKPFESKELLDKIGELVQKN